MKTLTRHAGLVRLLPAALLLWTTAAQASWTPFQVGIWDPIQLFRNERSVYGLGLNLIYGNNRNLVGLEVGFASNKRWMSAGLQVGAILNRVTGTARGLQVAGIINWVEGPFHGLQLSTINLGNGADGIQIGAANFNWRHGEESRVAGLQAGVLSLNSGHFYGLHLGGLSFMNYARGLVVSGLYNMAVGMKGIQIGALDTTEHLDGAQLGVMNIVVITAPSDAPPNRGLQLGLANVAGRIKGLQVGLVNYAARLTGLQLGLININRGGRVPFLPILNFGL
jgi:hypothetical protein